MDAAWFSGFFAVLVVMTFATTTNHMLFVANALKGVDYQTIEAAKNLGASDLDHPAPGGAAHAQAHAVRGHHPVLPDGAGALARRRSWAAATSRPSRP